MKTTLIKLYLLNGLVADGKKTRLIGVILSKSLGIELTVLYGIILSPIADTEGVTPAGKEEEFTPLDDPYSAPDQVLYVEIIIIIII